MLGGAADPVAFQGAMAVLAYHHQVIVFTAHLFQNGIDRIAQFDDYVIG